MHGDAARVVIACVLAALLAVPATALATHDADDHSPNARLVSSARIGSLADIAFWGDLAVASQFTFDDGSTDGFSVMDISEPAHPRELRRFVCTGAGWDVSMWGHLVFLSVDAFTPSLEGTCGSAPGTGFSGIKIVSIADPLNPVSVASVPMPCSGSHTNTLLPDPANDRVLVYAASSGYPDDAPEQSGCDAVISVPLSAPQEAKQLSPMPGDEVESCHDFAVHVERRLLAGACLSELRLFDISDPAAPRLLSTFVNPAQTFQHSVGFSNDGTVVISGEETVQSTGLQGGCTGGTPSPHGALWFHDISDPVVPILKSYHQVERGFEATSPGGAGCSIHNFNAVPAKSERDILAAGWYSGGMSLVDFTDPAQPEEIAHYLPDQANAAQRAHYWAAYWYRDHVYATSTFDTERAALDVYAVDGIGPTYRLPHLNPQTHEPLSDAPAPAPAAPASPPGTPLGTTSTPCKPGPARIKAPGRVRRATLGRRRLRIRGRVVKVNAKGLRAGTYTVRISYRSKARTRTLKRRVRVC